MKYIPQSLEVASRWVDVCWRSLGIDRDEVASMYANMCGFSNWDMLIATMLVENPSKTDESISQSDLLRRQEFYRDVLVDTFFMSPVLAKYLIQVASPSSSKVVCDFSAEFNKIFGGISGGLYISGDTLNQYAKGILEKKLGSDFDFNAFASQLRVHSDIYPGHWYNLVASLGWSIKTDSYKEKYEIGKPSMWLEYKEGSTPVYIVSLTKLPLEKSDDMANCIMQMVKDDVLSAGCNSAILFWGSMVSKNIKGRWFTHPGVILKNSEWKDFLINRHIGSLDCVYEMVDHLDISCPDAILEDYQMELNRGFGCSKLDADCAKMVRFDILSNPSGWIHLLPSLNNH